MNGIEKLGNLLLAWKAFITPEYFERTHHYISQIFFESLCFLLSAIGLRVRFIIAGYTSKGASGRNTKSQKAHTLNTSGFYSIIRHPIYFLVNLPYYRKRGLTSFG